MGGKELKARIDYKSKRNIIIISAAIVLLIAAIAGTVAFVKGNKNSAAAMTEGKTSTSQNDGTNAGLPNSGKQGNDNGQWEQRYHPINFPTLSIFVHLCFPLVFFVAGIQSNQFAEVVHLDDVILIHRTDSQLIFFRIAE